jgi:hypothetical protein
MPPQKGHVVAKLSSVPLPPVPTTSFFNTAVPSNAAMEGFVSLGKDILKARMQRITHDFNRFFITARFFIVFLEKNVVNQ